MGHLEHETGSDEASYRTLPSDSAASSVNGATGSDVLDDGSEAGTGGNAGDPLLDFLDALCEEHGQTKTAKRLGVDRKTLYRARQNGALTPRLRDALERERASSRQEQAGGDQLELRVASLEGRLQEVERQLAGASVTAREEVAVLREQVKAISLSRATGAGAGSGSTAGSACRSYVPHRIHPEVVTNEPQPDDEQVFGDSFGLVAEWREQRVVFLAHWPLIEGVQAELRMVEIEVELIEQHGLTLPPDKLPWTPWQREQELSRRGVRLRSTRSALRRARLRRFVIRLLTLGLVGRNRG